MADFYKTIELKSTGIYKEKGSKFFAYAYPVNSADEANNIVKYCKKEFYDARHVCYAYIIGKERDVFRINDDGEPSGTAGRPILGQLNSRELTNILVIVVRYFGGILLGTSGLATAYKEATADALNQSTIIEKTVEKIFTIKFDYLLLNETMKIIKESNVRVKQQHFDNCCEMQIIVPTQIENQFIEKLSNVKGMEINL